jgi:hypothetical protein
LRVLFKLAAWVGKAYVFPTQRKLVKLSGKWCGVEMSRRTLNRVLRSLEDAQYLERVRRHRKTSTGALELHSTLYKLKGRAFNLVYSGKVWGEKIFRVFRVPKMAQYPSTTERHLHFARSVVDNLERGGSKGGAAGPLSLTDILAVPNG